MWDLVLLLALAAALRLHDLGNLSLADNEILTALTARNLLHPETLSSSVLSAHLTVNPPRWLATQTFRVFGDGEWSARLPSAFAGILASIWIYLWGSHWFGSWVGRVAGFLFAIWPWPVAYGRLATGDSLLLFLAFLFTISLWKILEGNCLGHPLAEPPLIAGRKPMILRRFLKALPMMTVGFLCLWISPTAVSVLLVLPVYLLYRLAWSWSRGGTGDCEFKRSWIYLGASLVYLMTAAALMLWLHQGFPENGGIKYRPENLIPGVVHQLGVSEVILGGLLLAGTGMAALRGRPGWLVLLGAWIPVCVGMFLPSPNDLNLFSVSIPSLFLLLGMPFARSFEVLGEGLNHWTVEKKTFSWRFVLPFPVLLVGIFFISWNVLWAPQSTKSILDGDAFRASGKNADWRAMTDSIPRIGNKAAVVTVDPLHCLYYLGRVDFLYPDPASPMQGRDTLTGIPILPDARALLNFINSGHEVWILGARASFEETFKTQEGRVLWARITQPPSRVWEGPGEVVICWRGV